MYTEISPHGSDIVIGYFERARAIYLDTSNMPVSYQIYLKIGKQNIWDTSTEPGSHAGMLEQIQGYIRQGYFHMGHILSLETPSELGFDILVFLPVLDPPS